MKLFRHLFWRGVLLFFIGTFFTVVLNLLQAERYSLYTKGGRKGDLLYFRWWLPILCGTGSALVGLILPFFECKVKEQQLSQEWSHVLRCLAVFVGINEACTKIDFPSNFHLSVSLTVLSVGLWWYFDRTKVGLVLGIITAGVALITTQLLVYHEIFLYNERDNSFIQSRLPYVAFSGGITVASIGRQLAANDGAFNENKSHSE